MLHCDVGRKVVVALAQSAEDLGALVDSAIAPRIMGAIHTTVANTISHPAAAAKDQRAFVYNMIPPYLRHNC
jgi:hypothetical protein